MNFYGDYVTQFIFGYDINIFNIVESLFHYQSLDRILRLVCGCFHRF